MKRLIPGAAALLALAGCMPRTAPAVREHTLVYVRSFGPTSLDPGVSATGGEFPIQEQVYEQLVDLDQASPGSVKGDLAESWKVAADGRSIAFALAPDHRFSDGSKVDAEAVKFSLDRVKRLGRSSSSYLEWLDTVEVTGPLTLRLHLKRPYAPAVQMLAQAAASVINPAAAKAHDRHDDAVGWLSDHSAGSGPYQIADVVPGESVSLTTNRFSTRRPRQFTQVEFRIIPDEGVRRLLLERGDADINDIVSAAFVDRYRALPGVRVEMVPSGASVSFITLNTAKGAFRDVRLRRAVAAAIDYQALRDDVLKGNATQLPGYLTPGSPTFDPREPAPRRDLALARRLLAEARYDGRPLRFLISQIGPVAEFIQSNLRQAGINVVIERRSGGAVEAAKLSGDFDLLYDGWITDTPDPASMLEALYTTRSRAGGVNASAYSDPDVDQWVDEVIADQNPARRAELFQKIDTRLRRDRPLVMIFAAMPVVAFRADLRGVRQNPLKPFYFPIAELSRAPGGQKP